MIDFSVIIPARYESSRLPGKPLLDLAGLPMVLHVDAQARKSGAKRVIVATDDQRIADVVREAGAEACMTDVNHQSGTDRLQEVCAQLSLADDEVVVNVQGDEPMIPPRVIDQVARNLVSSGAQMSTLFEPIEDAADLFDPNIVKVVCDVDGFALYFSRAPLPWVRDSFGARREGVELCGEHKRHLGIYAYRVALLNEFVRWPQAPIEELEKLEQLRAMWHGVRIHAAEAAETIPPGVDTPADLERTRAAMRHPGSR